MVSRRGGGVVLSATPQAIGQHEYRNDLHIRNDAASSDSMWCGWDETVSATPGPDSGVKYGPGDGDSFCVYVDQPLYCYTTGTAVAFYDEAIILTPTPTLTASLTHTPTETPTRTATFTPTRTPTRTATFTPTSTKTRTFTKTPTPTHTPTNSRRPTLTPTRTFTPIPTHTETPTRTATRTPTDTPTSSPTSSPTNTPL